MEKVTFKMKAGIWMDDKLKIIELLKHQVTAKTAELTTENIQKTTQDIQDLLKILNDVAAIDFVATPSETPTKQERQQLLKKQPLNHPLQNRLSPRK